MGNDMFNEEQLKHAEILQKETEDALGFWKDRALKAEAKLADKYLIEEQYETACGDRDGLLRMVETLREQKTALEAERDALLSRPAPPSDAATKAVEAAREWLRHGRQWCQTCLEAADLLTRLVSTPAPTPVSFICSRCGRNGDYHGEPGGDRCEYCGGNCPVCPAPAPSAKEGRT